MNEVEFRKSILAELEAVHRLACHLARRGPAEADDCVQETYVRALRSRATFVLGPLGVRPWLFKILHNVLYTRGAKSRRERDVLEDLVRGGAGNVTPAAGEPCPHDDDDDAAGGGAAPPIDWDRVDERLKLAVAELPVAFRAAFLLSTVEGLRYREIADVMDVPIGTVTSRLARARAMLARRLADLAAERGLGARPPRAERRPDAEGGDAATVAPMPAEGETA